MLYHYLAHLNAFQSRLHDLIISESNWIDKLVDTWFV